MSVDVVFIGTMSSKLEDMPTRENRPRYNGSTYLVEANILGLLAEALAAEIEAILPDETGPVLADAAIEGKQNIISSGPSSQFAN